MLKRGSRLLLLLWLVAASLPAVAQTLAPLGTRLAREVDEPFPEDAHFLTVHG